MQAHGRARPGGGSPDHAVHRPQDGAIHRRQHPDRFPHPRLSEADLAHGPLGQLPHDPLQHLRAEQMLAGRKTAGRNSCAANLPPHPFKLGGGAQAPQAVEHRIEEPEQMERKVGIGREGAPGVLLRRARGAGRQARLEHLAEMVQKLPIAKLGFREIEDPFRHGARKAYPL